MGLNAEFNRPVAGLQLRLEGLNVVFLELRVIKKKFRKISSLSPIYRVPILKVGLVKSQKPEENIQCCTL